MKADEAGLQFPVLGVSKDKDCWGFKDLNDLTVCGRMTLRDGLQDGMELIDVAGSRWRVDRIQLIRPLESPLKRLFTWFLWSPGFRIQQNLSPLSPLSLQETQERVCAAMQAYPLHWCEEYEIETVFIDRLAEVRATKTIAEIHEVLGLTTFREF